MKNFILVTAILFLISQNAIAQAIPYQKENYSVVPAELPKDSLVETNEELPALGNPMLESTDSRGEYIAKQTGYYIYVSGRWVVKTTWRGIKKTSPYVWDGTTWTFGTLKKGFITGFNMISPIPLPL